MDDQESQIQLQNAESKLQVATAEANDHRQLIAAEWRHVVAGVTAELPSRIDAHARGRALRSADEMIKKGQGGIDEVRQKIRDEASVLCTRITEEMSAVDVLLDAHTRNAPVDDSSRIVNDAFRTARETGGWFGPLEEIMRTIGGSGRGDVSEVVADSLTGKTDRIESFLDGWSDLKCNVTDAQRALNREKVAQMWKPVI